MRTSPVTPAEVNDQIWSLIKRANEIITEIYKAGDEYIESKVDYEDTYAREVLKAEGTVQEKKAKADSACRDAYKRMLKGDVRYKYLKTVLETTRKQLDAAQSLGANMRDEWQISQRHKP
jgi:cystathionine beta-lyase family protein involved in aluminum resistance